MDDCCSEEEISESCCVEEQSCNDLKKEEEIMSDSALQHAATMSSSPSEEMEHYSLSDQEPLSLSSEKSVTKRVVVDFDDEFEVTKPQPRVEPATCVYSLYRQFN